MLAVHPVRIAVARVGRQRYGTQLSTREDSLRRFVALLLLLAATLLVGVAGYMLVEGWSFVDSLFMVATIATTVGFDEVRPLATAGRVFTMALIVMRLATIYSLFGTGIGIVFEGQLIRRREARRT
jgi:voltage-gated potassium channel